MDDLAALRLQIEWGVDEALFDIPTDRFIATPSASVPSQVAELHPSIIPTNAFPALAAKTAQAAADLPALQLALDGFHACPLRATASATVAPSGNPAAGLVFIGEAPGPDDDRAGQAFSGPLGDRLDRILLSAGLSRETVLLTMMVPWRPPGGRPPNEPELAQCLPFLHRLLTLTRPHHLVLLGAAPLRALHASEVSLRRARGKWTTIAVPGLASLIPAIPLLPPEMWLSSPLNKQHTWADLLSIREALNVQR